MDEKLLLQRDSFDRFLGSYWCLQASQREKKKTTKCPKEFTVVLCLRWYPLTWVIVVLAHVSNTLQVRAIGSCCCCRHRLWIWFLKMHLRHQNQAWCRKINHFMFVCLFAVSKKVKESWWQKVYDSKGTRVLVRTYVCCRSSSALIWVLHQPPASIIFTVWIWIFCATCVNHPFNPQRTKFLSVLRRKKKGTGRKSK